MASKELELKHIQLELQYGRCLPRYLRNFGDAWFCHQNGYVNSKGNAKWKEIIRREFVTEGAMNTIGNDLIVRKEHIVPLKVVSEKLLELGKDATLDEIEVVLRKWIVFATILRTEDKVLNGAGLRSKMPEGFYQKGHELYGDVFARYKECRIELIYAKKE